MSIEEKIVEEATSKAYSIIKEAKEERARALRTKEERLKEEMEKEIESFKEDLKEKRKEEMAAAKLESKRTIDNTYEEKFKEALDLVAEEFKKFKKGSSYKKWINELIKKAIEELGEKEENTIIHVSKGEKKHVKTKGKIKEDLNDLGGAIVENKEGRIRVNYSFSQLIELNKEKLREIFVKEFSKE